MKIAINSVNLQFVLSQICKIQRVQSLFLVLLSSLHAVAGDRGNLGYSSVLSDLYVFGLSLGLE